MAINNTKDFVYATPTGQVHVGDDPPPPDGSTVLVAPGGTIDDALAEKYKIADKLGEASGVRRDDAGNPIVVRSGKAIAADVLPADDPERMEVEEAAGKEDAPAGGKKDAARAAKKAAPAASTDEDADDDDMDDDAADESADDPSGLKVGRKAVHKTDAGVEDKAVKGPGARKGGPAKGK
jgi:hypothetical protein